jgi:hypothetical protein
LFKIKRRPPTDSEHYPAPSFPRHSTETASRFTMNDPHLNTLPALTLKFKLEAAIQAYLRNDPLVPLLDFQSPTFETDCIRNVQLAQRRINNITLIQLFGLGLWIRLLGNPYQPAKANHRIGAFLYDYFKDYPGAVGYLEEVNPTTIDKAGTKVLQALIKSIKKPQEGWGPTFSTQGDMWQAASNLVDSPRYSPKAVRSPTPPRINPEQEVWDLEEIFGQTQQQASPLLLCAPYSPAPRSPAPRPLKRSRVLE